MATSYVEKLQARRRKYWKALVLIGMLAFLTFIAFALFGESGILVNMRVKTEFRTLQEERDRLMAENARLRDEIKAIRTSPRKIEELGRKEFGFGRPGEIIFHFPAEEEQPIRKYEFPLGDERAVPEETQNL